MAWLSRLVWTRAEHRSPALYCIAVYRTMYSTAVTYSTPALRKHGAVEGWREILNKLQFFCVKCLDKHGVMRGGLRLAERLVCQRSPPMRGRRSGLLHERGAPSSGQPPYYSVAIHVKTLLAGLGGSQYRSVQQPAVQSSGPQQGRQGGAGVIPAHIAVQGSGGAGRTGQKLVGAT